MEGSGPIAAGGAIAARGKGGGLENGARPIVEDETDGDGDACGYHNAMELHRTAI
jgi:hypothetical protein